VYEESGPRFYVDFLRAIGQAIEEQARGTRYVNVVRIPRHGDGGYLLLATGVPDPPAQLHTDQSNSVSSTSGNGPSSSQNLS
jgi:hypothetical protein